MNKPPKDWDFGCPRSKYDYETYSRTKELHKTQKQHTSTLTELNNRLYNIEIRQVEILEALAELKTMIMYQPGAGTEYKKTAAHYKQMEKKKEKFFDSLYDEE